MSSDFPPLHLTCPLFSFPLQSPHIRPFPYLLLSCFRPPAIYFTRITFHYRARNYTEDVMHLLWMEVKRALAAYCTALNMCPQKPRSHMINKLTAHQEAVRRHPDKGKIADNVSAHQSALCLQTSEVSQIDYVGLNSLVCQVVNETRSIILKGYRYVIKT